MNKIICKKNNEMTFARPFVKWVGGKTQLITQLESMLPALFHDCTEITYIEPFIGGGEVFYTIYSKAIQTSKRP